MIHDRLNDSNNSNDGRERQHIQERQNKSKWSEKSSFERPKIRTVGNQNTKTTGADNAAHQISQERTIAQQNLQSVEITKKRGHYEKLCRSLKKIQHVEESIHQQKTTGTTIEYRR